jgi:hypothetical protein
MSEKEKEKNDDILPEDFGGDIEVAHEGKTNVKRRYKTKTSVRKKKGRATKPSGKLKNSKKRIKRKKKTRKH